MSWFPLPRKLGSEQMTPAQFSFPGVEHKIRQELEVASILNPFFNSYFGAAIIGSTAPGSPAPSWTLAI